MRRSIRRDSSIRQYKVLIDAFINLLKECGNDTNDWIGYFVWELDFGRDYTDGCVMINGKDVPLRTAEDLWNILKR